MYRILICSIVLLMSSSLVALEKSSAPPFKGHEKFDSFQPKHFTKFPLKNANVRDGVLWTHGQSGQKYPPSVGIPIDEKDCMLSFRYRYVGEGDMIWFFINGEDGFGGYDHILRIKLQRKAVGIQVDAHTKNPNHPNVQEGRKPDAASGAYRAPEKLPIAKVDLKENQWHQLTLVFKNDTVQMSLDGDHWQKKIKRPGFAHQKQELYWMIKGGDKGIEIDDVKVISD